ncbi:DNA phosphorothioation system sulfurtransferase DndC [Chloroflexales bacterium ZM16-3]|nr:DNA phosphorothioation system sulfurtransferase DndC [Chloroflexales bacterium ZM16-3]
MTIDLPATYRDIREVYLSNTMPWVIGYSGGKDSTATLQLVWLALRDLPRDQLTKPIFVIATDTLVETPLIVDHVNNNLGQIGRAAREAGLPLTVHRLTPEVNDSFWVNLLGRGYPTPHSRFRWCTERMKIKPADSFILGTVAKHGDVVLVLGQRHSESTSRAQVMDEYRITGSRLSRHSTLPRAYVYTPIDTFSTDDVWSYLLSVPSPWGGNNRDLASLYRSAQSGECPLVVDLSTPSCGNSRFGCWVCTVVERDRSMEALIDNGEEWMAPMLEFRDFLAATQQPERRAEVRDYRRRDGQVHYRKRGQGELLIRGPYKLEFRQDLLARLLDVQNQVRRDGPDPQYELISPAELYAIRRLWRAEAQDWEDSVKRIYRDVTHSDLPWPEDDGAIFGEAERALLAQICAEEDLPVGLMIALIESQHQATAGLGGRAATHARIDAALHSDWRSEADVVASVERHHQLVEAQASGINRA